MDSSVSPTYGNQEGSVYNGYFESFNGKLRDDVLNREVFYSVKEAKVIVENWRLEYNNHRPHSSLGYMTPAAFAAAWNPPGSACRISG